MHTLDWYGLGAAALIGIIFYAVHRIPIYAVLCALVAGFFACRTLGLVDWRQPGEWLILFAGILLTSFGLLIVRVMLIRSVSLQLLSRLASGNRAAGVAEDISARLRDMEYFKLIRRGEANRLTAFGWFCSTVVVIFYTMFRIK